MILTGYTITNGTSSTPSQESNWKKIFFQLDKYFFPVGWFFEGGRREAMKHRF